MSCYSSRNSPALVQSHGDKKSRGLSNLAAPEPDDAEKQYPEHIKRIVEDISKLTILEVSELNQLLKVNFLKIPQPSTPG